MKQIKVLIALLAVVFSVSSAFTPAHKFVNHLFTYDGTGNISLASNWVTVSTDQLCLGTNGTACTIIAIQDGTTIHPTQASIDALNTASSLFTQKVSPQPNGTKVEVRAN